MATKTSTNTRQQTLKNISKDLKEFDFSNFDLNKDKLVLMETLNNINVKLGKLLRGYQ